jgi:hypothetical protein
MKVAEPLLEWIRGMQIAGVRSEHAVFQMSDAAGTADAIFEA